MDYKSTNKIKGKWLVYHSLLIARHLLKLLLSPILHGLEKAQGEDPYISSRCFKILEHGNAKPNMIVTYIILPCISCLHRLVVMSNSSPECLYSHWTKLKYGNAHKYLLLPLFSTGGAPRRHHMSRAGTPSEFLFFFKFFAHVFCFLLGFS